MTSRESRMATAKTVISAIGSVAAATMVARSVLREYLPPEIKDHVYFTFRNFIHRFSTQLTLVIHEAGNGFSTNEIYDAAQIYLATKITPTIHRLKVSKPSKSNTIDVAIEPQEAVQDTYDGVKINWVLVHRKTPRKSQYNRYSRISETRSDERSFELSFHRKHKEMVLNEYIPFIVNEAKMKKKRNNTLQIYTVNGMDKYMGKPSSWSGVNLDHPATFATLAMDADVKEFLMKDLERFVERREYYRHVGKAWKRGYLLYGPPGTGKSSLIAAMANFLNFDIYDLELTDVKRNSELRRLLVGTANRSILVVEDIDCSVELHDRVATEGGSHIQVPANHRSKSNPHHEELKKVTLSGFLNFIDGLWSSCGDERIIVFTTNRKDKLDPALLRPGRMDVHIHMSYCTPQGFRILASNYLGVADHNLFEVIEELIKTTEVTPAEVAEELLKNDDHDVSLSEFVNFLHGKRKGKAKKEQTQSTSASTVTFTKHSSDLTLTNPIL